jgi:hypothetical protein
MDDAAPVEAHDTVARVRDGVLGGLGTLALGGLAAAPGADSAAVPGLAVMLLRLPVAVGGALGDRRAGARSPAMLPWTSGDRAGIAVAGEG